MREVYARVSKYSKFVFPLTRYLLSNEEVLEKVTLYYGVPFHLYLVFCCFTEVLSEYLLIGVVLFSVNTYLLVLLIIVNLFECCILTWNIWGIYFKSKIKKDKQ